MSTATKSSVELVELGKFFTVTARRLDAGHTAPEMFSTAIDAVWHQLADAPQVHAAFTTEHAGRKLTHVETAGCGLIAWVAAYGEMYGPLPEIWFTNADGTINERSLTLYRKTGTVVAEWDCAPTPSDGDMTPNATVR
ncbi:hypothetical protein ACFT9I_30080 [Streptomyces sp. NPDC057137]|uniref:hypothetical protein n=1 Tax=Streptomyces sp. NPDC057137 TaxID=3346030 RepID=UPI0036339E0F